MARILALTKESDQYGAIRMGMHYMGALIDAGHEVLLAIQTAPEAGSIGEAVIGEMNARGIETRIIPRTPYAAFPLGCVEIDRLARDRDLVMNVHLRMAPAAANVGKRVGIPSLIFTQNIARYPGNAISRWVQGRVYANAIRQNASHVICIAEEVANHQVKNLGADRSKVTTIPNGFDFSRDLVPTGDEAASVREEFGISDSELIGVNLARISRQKGQDVLIKAVAHMGETARKLRVIVAGGVDPKEAALEGQLMDLADQLNVADRFIWLGFRDDGPRLLHAADISLLPSAWDFYPNAMMESFAARKPLLMTQFTWPMPGFESGVHGWETPNGDAEAFGDQLCEFVSMPVEQRREVGNAGRRFLEENLSLEKGKARFVSIAEELLHESGVHRTENLEKVS